MIPEVVQAIADLTAARQQKDAAAAGYAVARAQVRQRLIELGPDAELSLEEARSLYWDEPAVEAKSIAAALGLGTTGRYLQRLLELVGERYDVLCRDCGAVLRTRYTSKTSPEIPTSRSFDYCDSCAQANWEESQRSDAAREAVYAAEEVVYTERVAAGGYWIDSDGNLVLDPDERPRSIGWHQAGDGYHADARTSGQQCEGGGPSWVALNPEDYYLVDPGAINYVCRVCGATTSVKLVTWVPEKSVDADSPSL